MNKPLTIFCDLDGTLIAHQGSLIDCIATPPGRLLPGVEKWLQFVYSHGHRLIITTGRPEVLREETAAICKQLGIFYDQLVMGCTPGSRVVMNDYKDGDPPHMRAFGLNVLRNEGINDETFEAFKEW